MTRLSELLRIELTQGDKTSLVEIALQYEEASELYADPGDPKKDLKNWRQTITQASRARSTAVTWLIKWAERRLTETVVGAGFPRGSNFPRLKKAYDASYNHRKWGSDGCSREAAKYLRSVIKRGWL